jgi:hypothetical protein
MWRAGEGSNMIVEELYDALIEAGASEQKARAASRAIVDMDGHFTDIQTDISRLDQKVERDTSRLDQKLDQKISELRSYVIHASRRNSAAPQLDARNDSRFSRRRLL